MSHFHKPGLEWLSVDPAKNGMFYVLWRAEAVYRAHSTLQLLQGVMISRRGACISVASKKAQLLFGNVGAEKAFCQIVGITGEQRFFFFSSQPRAMFFQALPIYFPTCQNI